MLGLTELVNELVNNTRLSMVLWVVAGISVMNEVFMECIYIYIYYV